MNDKEQIVKNFLLNLILRTVWVLIPLSSFSQAVPRYSPDRLPYSICSSPSLTENSVISVTGTPAWVGPMRFTNSFTITAGSTLMLNGEFLISPSVSITVKPYGKLLLIGAHLYGCLEMWKGIVIEDGGNVSAVNYNGADNLIEDAEVAILNTYNTNVQAPISIANTIFNKNYIDVDLANYPLADALISPFDNCVFTCRDLPFTSTTWPSVSTASTGLRFASTNTAAPLASPYLLQSFPVTTLKIPHAGERSLTALKLNKMGRTDQTGPIGLTFYNANFSPANGFNLYDAHCYFIRSVNSNVKLSNSVFQNTQTFSVSNTQTVGAAIDYSCSVLTTYTPNSTIHNYELDMSAPSFTSGNRFYDCHKDIVGVAPFSFKLKKSTHRSTHLASNATSTAIISTGQTGVFMKTNQMEDYIIENNEFANISDGVVISLYPNNFMRPGFDYLNVTTGPYVGQYFLSYAYIHALSITGNTFSPEDNTTFTGATNGYVKNAISVSTDNYALTWSGCGCSGIYIENNNIYRTLNGVRLSGANPYTMTCRVVGSKKIIRSNTILLQEDNVLGGILQKGIEYTNSLSEPVQLGQRLQAVEANTISVFGGASAMNNANINLYYGQGNGGTGTLFPTPHILCNDLSNANKGFVFENHNRPASWRGNKMQDLKMGMVLTGNAATGGVIGQQGDATQPSANEWKGSWGSTNYGTWVELGSDAKLSSLYLQANTGQWFPPNNLGNAMTTEQYNTLNNSLKISTSGSYSCGAAGNYTLMNSPPPAAPSYSSEPWYLSATFAYRYLVINDSMRNVDPALLDFFNGLAGTSIDVFMQVEMKMSERKFTEARNILDAMSTSGFNATESAYYSFYDLSLKYKINEADFAPNDLNALRQLAGLCPGRMGSIVYQIRALYQLITSQVYNGPDECGEAGARASQPPIDSTQSALRQNWDVSLFPNPNNGNFMIISKDETEVLEVAIRDASGRELYRKRIQTSKYYYVLDLALSNGVYFVTIKNSLNESVTKKMGIAK